MLLRFLPFLLFLSPASLLQKSGTANQPPVANPCRVTSPSGRGNAYYEKKDADRMIQNYDQTLRDADRTIQNYDQTLRDADRTIQNYDQTLRDADRTIQNYDQTLRDADRTI